MRFSPELIYLVSICIWMTTGCKQEQKTTGSVGLRDYKQADILLQNLQVSVPSNLYFKIGDTICFTYHFQNPDCTADSLKIDMNGERLIQPGRNERKFILPTNNEHPGIKNIVFTAFYPDGTLENSRVSLTLVSNIVPGIYTYKIIKEYTHDMQAYTQGLVYEDNMLYEGTGLSGKSTLRKVSLENGMPLQVLNLPPDVFGEGIACVGDFIYQLTYRNKMAMKFKKQSFELVGQFPYSMNEGWGLTYDGVNLIMSDGSNYLYFIDPDGFVVRKRVEVYDNHRPLDRLNELEYIHGEVWANIYTTDTIVTIEPATGRVTRKIVLKDIVKPADRHPDMDCLNGIAYDPQKERLFVTGKNWKKLYEVEIVKK